MVLEAGGGAEGVVDRGWGLGDGARAGADEVVFFGLFSCSLRDMAIASWRSSSSCSSPPPGPEAAERGV